MKYSLLLLQNEKQVLESIQKQFNLAFSGKYPSDFQIIRTALEKRWKDLKAGEVSLEILSAFESQVKYMKNLDAVLKKTYEQRKKEIADQRALIHDHFTNW